jgi:hypothetical protein
MSLPLSSLPYEHIHVLYALITTTRDADALQEQPLPARDDVHSCGDLSHTLDTGLCQGQVAILLPLEQWLSLSTLT